MTSGANVALGNRHKPIRHTDKRLKSEARVDGPMSVRTNKYNFDS